MHCLSSRKQLLSLFFDKCILLESCLICGFGATTSSSTIKRNYYHIGGKQTLFLTSRVLWATEQVFDVRIVHFEFEKFKVFFQNLYFGVTEMLQPLHAFLNVIDNCK